MTFQAAYDAGFGVVTSSLDFNAHLTSYAYDEFARLSSVTKPGDSPAYPASEYRYGLGVPFNGTGIVNFVETRQLDKPAGSLPQREDHYFFSRQYVDGLGRKLMTREEGAEQPADGPRVSVNDAAVYNARQGVCGG